MLRFIIYLKMADNGNLSDHEQFVSAQGSENSSIAGDLVSGEEAVFEQNDDVASGSQGGNGEEDQEEEEEEAEEAGVEDREGYNVIDDEEALLFGGQDQHNGSNDSSSDASDGEDLGEDDGGFDDEIDDEEDVMEEEGEEAHEELGLGIHFSNPSNRISPGPGCSHYRRGCALIAPCCNKRYPCRHCHNENEQHEINRFAISEVVCLSCDKRQEISGRCVECSALFGNYVCLKCRVWDMDFKGQWHCDGCGICRLGGKDHFFHCDRCGYCLSVALRGDHRCIERATRTGCAICLSDLHDTRTPLVVPACGHPVHRSCWRQMIDSRRYFCPTCRRAVVDLTDIWADLDNRIGDQLNRLPPEFCLPIFCNDCQQHSSVRYNIIGYFKCPGCGSYNTQR